MLRVNIIILFYIIKKYITYKNFLEEHNFEKSSIQGYFILPIEEDEAIEIALVSIYF